MTTTKHRISSKIFVASIVAVIILSLLISPIMAITVTAATSSDASYSDEFKGYGEEKTNEEIHLLTRLTSPSEDAPSMTVLVHGQGGNASHWSNDDPWSNDPNWSKEKGVEFEYDSTSLIESLRTLYPNSDVFLADMITSTKFNLMKLNRGDYDETKRENIKQLNDVSKHIMYLAKNTPSFPLFLLKKEHIPHSQIQHKCNPLNHLNYKHIHIHELFYWKKRIVMFLH